MNLHSVPPDLIGNGEALDSPAIQHAIDQLAARGGGTVHLPAGIYRCGTLHLRSRITLHLDPGATLLGSTDLRDYPEVGDASPDIDRHRHHLIVIRDCEHVRLCGGGTIDGQGPAFWEPASPDSVWLRPRGQRPSPMIEMSGSSDVRIDDLTLREAAGWTLHAHTCDRVWLRGVVVRNHRFGPNNDGFDLNGCRDVFISDCHIDTNDDAIVLKTSRDARSCERIVIQNCILRTHCAAIKCGTESWHDFRHITVSNCVVHGSNRAVAFYAFDGATMEHITIGNLTVDTEVPMAFNHPVHFDTRRRRPDSAPSRIRFVSLHNLSVLTDGRLLFTAADGCELSDLALHQVQMRYALLCDPAPLAPGATSAQCSRHNHEARAARAAIVAENVLRLDLTGLRITWPVPGAFPAWAEGQPRFENGGARRSGPANESAPVAFHALWARQALDSHIDLTRCQASDGTSPVADVDAASAPSLRRPAP